MKLNDTQAMVLGFLVDQEPSTGADIYRRAEAVKTFWSCNRSSVYKELHALVQLGLVRITNAKSGSTWPRYAATTRGRKSFRAWLAKPGKVLVRDSQKLRAHFDATVNPFA